MANRRLSLLDSNFLHLETPTMHMHVAALMVFEPPADADEDFAGDLVRSFRETRVFQNPWNYRLSNAGRRQLRPRLEEVHDVDMEYHVRHLALPRPGGERELGQLIARLHSQPLDRRKPLWEVHVIEGLAHGRFAVYLKIHHCLVDGYSATILLSRALAADADNRDHLPWWAHPAAVPGNEERDQKKRPKKRQRKRRLPGPLALGRTVREAAATWLPDRQGEAASLTTAPYSILNSRLHSQRRFATHSESLDRLKAIAAAADATLNDVVLAITGAVLREYLLERDALPEQPLTALIPVSMHEAGSGTIENNISIIVSSLGTHVADDRKRLEVVKASVDAAKARLRELAPGTADLYSGLLVGPVVGNMVSPLAGRSRPLFNTIVSNVPGPSRQLYLRGARLAHLYPVSIPFHGVGLNVTCFSNAGYLNFGLTACRDTVPQVQQMAVALGSAVDRLEQALGAGESGKVERIARQRTRKS